jgi:hypothetical protein
MPASGNPRRPAWTGEELDFLRETMDMPRLEVGEALGRSAEAVAQARSRMRLGRRENKPVDSYAVKAPGEYIELLSAYLAEDLGCMEIWCRWNGYATYRVTGRDVMGFVVLLCTAK